MVIERYLHKLYSGAFPVRPALCYQRASCWVILFPASQHSSKLLLLHDAMSLGIARRALSHRCHLPLTNLSNRDTMTLYATSPSRFLGAEPDGPFTVVTYIFCLPGLSVSS